MGEDGASVLLEKLLKYSTTTSLLFTVQFVDLEVKVSFKSPQYDIGYNDTTASILGSYSAIYIFILLLFTSSKFLLQHFTLLLLFPPYTTDKE